MSRPRPMFAGAICAWLLSACGGAASPVSPQESAAGLPDAVVAAAPSSVEAPDTSVTLSVLEVPVTVPEDEAALLPIDPQEPASLALWRMGFDAGESLVPYGTGEQGEELVALPIAEAGDSMDVTAHPGRLLVQYEGGSASERYAALVPGIGVAGSRGLRFSLMAANVSSASGTPVKGRVQLNAYAAETIRAREVRFSTRMYLHEGFDALRTLGQTFSWLTISEWWNDASWTGQAYPFRISVSITKPAASRGSPLRFAVSAETLNVETKAWDAPLWKATNLDVDVPVRQWVTLEYHFREGNATEGRFYLAMVPDGGSRVVLFDQRGWTHHPANPAPDGLTHFNPLKLYTSKAIIDAVRASGFELSVDWDDLSLRLCRTLQDAATSPCRPESFR